jgi:hypothetical protein
MDVTSSLQMDGSSSLAGGRSAVDVTCSRDENAPACLLCATRFNAVNRRHHCRTCRRAVCQACSPNKLPVEGYNGPQRVCTPCLGEGLALAQSGPQPAVSTSVVGGNFVANSTLNWAEDTPICAVCSINFDLFERRHHCRACGQCVCQACSPNQLLVHGYTGPQRVCTPCVGGGMRGPPRDRASSGMFIPCSSPDEEERDEKNMVDA